ncbi:class I SAM-dependent methyltransferase [Flavobacterium sp. F-328]|uniref:Class I SAM-dependent methyltransferase n=1 Tax=Flavobacterium erciyesense TaxID=2825842 RepID=A0ABS5D340_9FLAO|nr:class I SAM-dependent methyltransferase [Flavobacterium erciyesense]MBQ0908414.1 class I SAM-dependent methyltransferase [Flavobacterium erciyesense]
MSKKSTGERLEFFDFSDVTVEHLHRYAIANDFVEGKVILDIASGEGYGSYILSKKALEVIGVDIDFESVQNAKEKYLKDNLKFIVGNADNIPVESNSIDIVVSFETIEHHDKHEEMFLEIKRVLKDDGILIMSSPDKKYYSDIPKFKNKFHVKELYFDEFECLTKKHFSFSKFYLQKAYNLNSLVSNICDFNNIVVYSGDQSNVSKSANQHLYILTIAAQHDINELPTSFFNGADINKVILENYLICITNTIRNTTSYKFGNLFIKPIYLFSSFIKKRFK